MSDLLSHLNAKNAEMQAWIDANPGSWGSIFHTDIPHWNESGVFTAEDLDDYLDSCHRREMQKMAWYGDDEDDIHMSTADRNYFDMQDRENTPDAHVYDYEMMQWETEQEMKKYGVDTIIMIPTHYEIMANNAGFLEY